MSVATSTSLVTLPTIGAKDLKAMAVIVNPDAMSKAIANNRVAEYADKLSGAYNDLTLIQDGIERSKTVTGAYVWESYRLLNGGSVNGIGDAVADKLGRWVTPDKGGEKFWKPLSTGSVTRYGMIARLHFVFKFDTSDPQWSRLTSEFVSVTSMTKILRDPKATKADVIREYDRLVAADAEAKRLAIEAAKAKAIEDAEAKAKADAEAKASDDAATADALAKTKADGDAPDTSDSVSTPGTDATSNTRGAAPDAGKAVLTFKSNGPRIDAMETLRAALTPLTVDQFVALHAHLEAVADVLSRCDLDTRTKALAKIAAAKSE